MKRLLFLAAALLCIGGYAVAQKTVPDSVVGGIFNSTPPVLPNLTPAPLQLDASGNLMVNSAAGVACTGCATSANQATMIADLQTLINQAITLPVAVNPVMTAGTVGTGGTFQSVLSANAARKGCIIVNNSSNSGKIFSGTTGGAHTAFLPLSSGQTYNCSSYLTVDVNNIDYTSTTNGDAFTVMAW